MDRINDFFKKNDKAIVLASGIGALVCTLIYYIGTTVEKTFQASFLTGFVLLIAIVFSTAYGVFTSNKKVTSVGLVVYGSYLLITNWSEWIGNLQSLSSSEFSPAYKTFLAFSSIEAMCFVAFGVLIIIEYFKKKAAFPLAKESLFLAIVGLEFICLIIGTVVVAQGNAYWPAVFSFIESLLLSVFLYTGYLNYITPEEHDVVRVFDENGGNTIEMESAENV